MTAVPLSAAPEVYGPPNPSAVAQIITLKAMAEMYVGLRANPRITGTAMSVSTTATK